jgi:hypothetical protein
MKRLLTATLALATIAAAAPAHALTERFNDSYRDNLNKGIATEISLSDRQQDEFVDGLNRLTERFDDSYRDNLNKGIATEVSLSDRQQDEFVDGLNRLTERFNDERGTTLNR